MLVTRLFRAAALLVLWGVLTPNLTKLQTDDISLLETLLSSQASDQQWQQAADSFRKLPPEVAIRALYPEIAKDAAPSVLHYNCTDDPSIDRHSGVSGRRHCVASLLWRETLSRGMGDPKVGKTLRELWTQLRYAPGRSALVYALCGNWDPAAEEFVRKVFADDVAASSLRAQAAGCLLGRLGTKYQHDVIIFALHSSPQIRGSLFDALVSPPYARVSGIDASVVRMGFWILFESLSSDEERFAHGSGDSSYFGPFRTASALGTYLGEGFTPDYKLPKYQGEQGRARWYRETTENALMWWLKNKKRYESTARSSRP